MCTKVLRLAPLLSVEERNRGKMKRICLAFVAAASLACLVGGCAEKNQHCLRDTGPQACADGAQAAPVCQNCGGRGCPLCRGGAETAAASQPGPPTGTVAYPYYTTHGPRDYFDKNPPAIGP